MKKLRVSIIFVNEMFDLNVVNWSFDAMQVKRENELKSVQSAQINNKSSCGALRVILISYIVAGSF